MGEAINATTNFEIGPSVPNFGGEVILVDEFIGDVGNLDANIFESIKRCAKIEVLDVKTGKFRSSTGQDTIEYKLGKFKGTCGGADIARVTDEVAAYGDSSAV